LLALGQRGLRTKQLTEQVPDFSARSVYRCVGKLEAHGLLEHRPEPDAPSRVLLRLTEPAGRNLVRLLRRFTSESSAGTGFPAGTTGGSGLSWNSLCLLGELWEWGFAAALAHGSRSLVDLLETADGHTYHQVRRKTTQFVDEGLLVGGARNGHGRRYQLSERGRRCMVVIASLGRWRHRHLLADGTPGLEIGEMATVLRATLPLVALPKYDGRCIDIVVTGVEDKYGHRDTAELRGAVDGSGALAVGAVDEEAADGSAMATTSTWFAALLDGNRGRIRVRGDLALVDTCLTRLYHELWIPLKP
jgi:DNA-binding HxlR family transcriptional regulator